MYLPAGNYTAADSGNWGRVLTVETRNVIVTGWQVRGNFGVTSPDGLGLYTFPGSADLSYGDWHADTPVHIVNVGIDNIETMVDEGDPPVFP